MPGNNQYRTIQSGDPVRVTLKDATTLDGNVRRLLNSETLIVTTPLGEDDPELQTIYYIDDYVTMVSPIPA